MGLLVSAGFVSGVAAQEFSDEVKEALFHAAMAAGCPSNDDDTSLGLAQAVLDSENFNETDAKSIYDDAIDENPEVDQGTAALACGIIERIEQDHPHQ